MTTITWVEESFDITDGPAVHQLILSHQLHLAMHLGDIPYHTQRLYFSVEGERCGFSLLTITGLTAGRSSGELAFTAYSQNVHCHSARGFYTPRTRKGTIIAQVHADWRVVWIALSEKH